MGPKEEGKRRKERAQFVVPAPQTNQRSQHETRSDSLFSRLSDDIRLDLYYFWHPSEEDNGASSQDRVLGTDLRLKF